MTLPRPALLLIVSSLLLSGCADAPDSAPAGPTIVADRIQDLILDFDRAEQRVEGRPPKENEPVHIKVAKMACGEIARTALQVHPPAEVIYEIRLPPEARLRTAVGVDDRVASHSDGVRFVVELEADGEAVPLWNRHLLPQRDQGWQPVEVDLSAWANRTVRLALRTEPAGNASGDWAGFASPQILSSGHPAPAPDFRPGVATLISLDTLRLDEVGACGSPHPVTPQLDNLLRRTLHHHQALSPSHWTMPAHLSALTSTYPDVHGVEPGGSLSDDIPTLAETLAKEGFHSAAFVEDVPWLRPSYGFDRGFQTYLLTREPAHLRVGRVREFLERTRGPLLLFVHFYDAHSDLRQAPYDASALAYRFAAPDLASFPLCRGEACVKAILKRMNDRGERYGPEAELAMRQMYRAGLLDLDLALGQLHRHLDSLGVLAAGPLILMSDHGEEFWDHGRYMHTQVYAETTRVLLARTIPDGPPPGLRPGLASLVDVAPTIAAALGIAAPPTWQGSDLASEPEVDVLTVGQRGDLALRTEAWTLVRHTDGSSEGYDRLLDPGEAAPAEPDPKLEERLDSLLAQHAILRRSLGAEPGSLSETELEELRELGYADR